MSPAVPVYLWGLVVDKYPVTVAEMRAAYPRYQSPWPGLPDDVPATGVSWYEANVYALRRGMRLPSVLEWLVAAGARDGRHFPWGHEEDPSRCNCREGGRGRPTPVHEFDGRGASPYGVCDLLGNVWEMTATVFPDLSEPFREARYDADEGDEGDEGAGDGRCPTIIGGYYDNTLRDGGLAGEYLGKRDLCLPEAGNEIIGFRCVRDFRDEDFRQRAAEYHQEARAFFRAAGFRTYPEGGMICDGCGKTFPPNDGLLLAVSVSSPLCYCRRCLKEEVKRAADHAETEGDGKVYFGHCLISAPAYARGQAPQRCPWYHSVPVDKADSILSAL